MTKKYNEIETKDNMDVNEDEEIVDKTKKEEKKKLDKIISTQPKKRKKGLVGRLTTGLLGPEGASGIGAYVNDEIIVPAIKNIIVDAVTSGINMVMYGENKRQGGGAPTAYSRNRTTYKPNTNYTSRYTSTQPDPSPAPRVTKPSKTGVEEYVIDDRFDAAHVLNALTEHADMYDRVSVADYYDIIGAPSQFTDHNYGWTIDTISTANITPVRGGYIINFPPLEVI